MVSVLRSFRRVGGTTEATGWTDFGQLDRSAEVQKSGLKVYRCTSMEECMDTSGRPLAYSFLHDQHGTSSMDAIWHWPAEAESWLESRCWISGSVAFMVLALML